MATLAGAFKPMTPWETWTTANRFIVAGMPTPMMHQGIGHSVFCRLFTIIGGYSARRFQGVLEQDFAG